MQYIKDFIPYTGDDEDDDDDEPNQRHLVVEKKLF